MIFIASDHAGVDLKRRLVLDLNNRQQPVSDLGPETTDSVDYPDFAGKLCQSVLQHAGSRGILLCGSGIGMSIAANRFKGIRAALCWSETIACLSRQHNNANVLVLPARFLQDQEAITIMNAWLNTSFEGGRHENRIQKIESLC